MECSRATRNSGLLNYPGAMRMYIRKTSPSKIQTRLNIKTPIQLHFFETLRTTPVITRITNTKENTPYPTISSPMREVVKPTIKPEMERTKNNAAVDDEV